MAVGGIFVTLRAITSKFQADMSKAKAAVDRFSKSTVNINRQLKRVGKQMSKVGKQMAASFSLPIVAAGGLAVKTFAEFEQSMAKVQAVSGATGEEFKKLEKLAKDLGASTRFTAAQVAELELNYSKLGFVPAEIAKITKPTLALALATGEDLANSAEVAGATLRGLGLTAADMPRVVDVMAKSFSSSALDLESFREAMKLVAPTAVATGRDLETVTAQLGILANNGIKGSIAGTQLNRVFIELNKKGLSLEEALDKVSNSSNGLATATDLVKDRGAKALLILAKQRKELIPFEESLRNAGGAAEKMANIMDDTLNGALLKVQSALEGAAIELGDTLAPSVKKAGEFIADLANKFSALSPETKKMIAIVAGLAAAIGPLLVVLGVMATTVLPALITGFALLLSPIALIAGAIAGLVAVAAAVFFHFNRIKTAQEGLNDVMNDARSSIAGEVAEINKLVKIAKSEVLSREQRQAAIDKLQSKYPDYLKNLTLESIGSDEVTGKIIKLKESILQLAQARALEARIQEIETEKLKLTTDAAEDNLTMVDKLKAAAALLINPLNQVAVAQELQAIALIRTKEQMNALNSESDLLIEKLADLETQQIGTNATTKSAAELAKKAAEAEANRAKTLAALAQKAAPTEIEPPKKAKAKEEKELIPLIILLQRAQEEAKKFSEAFSDAPAGALERQRDALGDFITKSLQLGESVASLQPQIDEFNRLGDAIRKTNEEQAMLQAKASAVSEAVGSAFTAMGERIAASFIDASTAGGRFLQGLVQTAIKLIAMALSTSIANSILGATASGAATGPAAIVATPVFIATAVAGILGAFAAIPAFAHGGMAFGATLALVGEGRGTSRSNPEVMMGLDKLQGMVDGGGGRAMGGNVIFEIAGTKLRGVLRNTDIRSGFTTSGTNLKG